MKEYLIYIVFIFLFATGILVGTVITDVKYSNLRTYEEGYIDAINQIEISSILVSHDSTIQLYYVHDSVYIFTFQKEKVEWQ